MGWVSWPLYIFVFLASLSALWWPNIWSKIGFPEPFEKTIGSIHYIPGIYPYGVSLLTPIHFCVGYFWMRWVVIRAGVYCPHLWAQLVSLKNHTSAHSALISLFSQRAYELATMLNQIPDTWLVSLMIHQTRNRWNYVLQKIWKIHHQENNPDQ